jgi:hypothetical protein
MRPDGGFCNIRTQEWNPDPFRSTGKVKFPVSDVVVELKPASGARYAVADQGGRFVFDGLAQGDYQLSAFERGFPSVPTFERSEKDTRPGTGARHNGTFGYSPVLGPLIQKTFYCTSVRCQPLASQSVLNRSLTFDS